jgi:hypothetical protein
VNRGLLALSGVLTALAFSAVASGANPRPYVLKRPAREHCRSHYARVIKRAKVRRHGKTVRIRQVWCVYKRATTSPSPAESPLPPTTTPAGLIVTLTAINAWTPGGTPSHINVNGTIYYGRLRIGQLKELTGQPIAYTIRDATTGQTIGSFVRLSGPGNCSVVYNVEGGMQIYKGEAVSPYPGCAFGTVTAPAADSVRLRGSFAGNTTYAPSASKEEPLH